MKSRIALELEHEANMFTMEHNVENSKFAQFNFEFSGILCTAEGRYQFYRDDVCANVAT